MNRELLIQALQNYQTPFKEEEMFRADFLELLRHPKAYHRNHLPGHMTGSSWIVDHSRSYVLLTHHAKLNKWLQPGGHADGDENILHVARREAIEETGLTDFKLLLNTIFDIDIHPIPARRDFPEHLHYDIRFLFEADRKRPLLISEESHALQWVPLSELDELTDNNNSIMRMANKLS